MLNNADWMSKLYENLPLKEITVPGTHNSGSDDIHCGSEWNPHRTGMVAKWAKIAKYTLPCVNVNYSKLQNFSIDNQFKMGIRYFDLRVAKSNQDEYRFTHGLLGGNFLKGIKDLIQVSEEYPKEILTLDIRFIYGFNKEDHIYFQKQLKNIIGDRLAKYTELSPQNTLSEYWNKGKNIIVVYKSDIIYRDIDFWPAMKTLVRWPNKIDSDQAIEYLKKYIYKDDKENRFYGLYCIITPTNKYVATHLFGTTQKLAKTLNESFRNLIENTKDINAFKSISFIAYDIAEYPGMSKTIIDLNLRKSEHKRKNQNPKSKIRKSKI